MSINERIGFGFSIANAKTALETIVRAEAAGIGTAWTVMQALNRDSLTLYGAASVQTSTIKLGTSIVPAFTRHPLGMATQLITLEDLAPGRIRLGIGTAHQRTMIPAYGFPFDRPLDQLREYLQVLRPALQTGRADFEGEFYRVHAALPYATGTPVFISALRERAFETAGELTDGAITWLCPFDYLEHVGRPALERGAATAGRQAPPLIAHVLVSPRTDRAAVLASARTMLRGYAEAVFYQRMFADAGFPLGADLALPDALIETLVVSGGVDEIRAGMTERLDRGADELLLSLVASDEPAVDEAALFDIMSKL
jgi:alkanesulfonate monooxygenase SsuD/methylene tetrahydromethanopterin reductase-like flavin-dependent oxidoreductase (luciferase family)